VSSNNKASGKRQEPSANRQARKKGSPTLPAVAMFFWSKLVEFSRNWSKNLAPACRAIAPRRSAAKVRAQKRDSGPISPSRRL